MLTRCPNPFKFIFSTLFEPANYHSFCSGPFKAVPISRKTVRRAPMNIIGWGDQLYFISCSFWLCLDAIRDRETSIIIWPFFIVVNAKIRPNNYFSGIYDVISYDVTLALSFKNPDQGNFGRTKFRMVVAKVFTRNFQFCHTK